MFFERSEDLKPTRFVPLVVDAAGDLGGTSSRPAIIERAVHLGQFTAEELAVDSHRVQDREQGRTAVLGTLRYAIWAARTRGDLLDGDTGGRQVLTDQGRARIGSATGYPELDRRRLVPGAPQSSTIVAELRPFVPAPTESLEARSLSDALPRTGAFDLDRLDRRTFEHHQLQRDAAAWLEGHGWQVGSAPRGTVLADLMAEKDGRWIVVEVKTLDRDRPTLETQQLRLGLGQVLDYRERLRSVYADTEAMLVVSHRPDDSTWEGTLEAVGVALAPAPLDAVVPPRHEVDDVAWEPRAHEGD